MRENRGTIDRGFLYSLIVLVALGLLMLLSASGPVGYQKFDDVLYFFTHQITYGLIPGFILFVIFAKIDYRKYVKFAPAALILSIVLLLLVYVPGIGMRFGGSGRWVDFGLFSFQPSEFVKIGFLIYVAAWLEKRIENKEAHTLEKGLIPFLIALGVIMTLLIMQPNTGSMVVIAGSALTAYFISGAPLVYFFGIGGAGAALFWILISTTDYRAQRVTTFLHPELDPQGNGYHITQAFLAIGSGGFWGLGYGHSRQKYLYLPEVAGDSIFAVIAEELGFFITGLILLLLGFFIYRCFDIARKAKDPFGQFLAVGIGAWISIQSALNIASMLGLVPITGVTLPFFSYGSSAFVALAIACGIMASISKGTNLWQGR
ncbi:MAG: putative lipid II flippase FtsW [Patescibacteria group bacterium]|nr:putative lipid II flippase FtsW [Patescibacteria group bacterium]